MKPLQMAVMGAGLIGKRHIKTILARPDLANLVAIVDPYLPPGQDNEWQVPVFLNISAMLEAVRTDAVIIASPNNLHLDHGLECCLQRLHFILEKPVTPTIGEARKLIEAVEKARVHTLVGHHRRYLPQVQKAKKCIENGDIGQLVAASVIWATRKPEDYFNAGWRKSPGGGPILINVIHDIDMLRYLCGEVVEVRGMYSNQQRHFPVEDTAGAIIKFENGCIATLICTDAGLSPWTIEQGSGENPSYAFTHESAYRLIGTTGSLEMPVLRKWSARTPGEEAWDKPLTSEYLLNPSWDVYEEQLAHFKRVIQAGEAPICSVMDAAKSLAATLGIVEDCSEYSGIRPQL